MRRITGLLALPTAYPRRRSLWLGLVALLCGLVGIVWLRQSATAPGLPASPPRLYTELTPGATASMDSPIFVYSPGWQVDPRGADPSEPADPWREPAGSVEFDFQGNSLWLLLATGDYWGYLYVTIDGQPVNRLPVIAGNRNSLGQPAGYRTFYAPERQTPTGPGEQWIEVHRSSAVPAELQRVRVEVWRSWGQRPLRGVAVSNAPPLPIWPASLLLLFAFGCVTVTALPAMRPTPLPPVDQHRPSLPVTAPAMIVAAEKFALPLAVAGLLLVAIAVVWAHWWLTLAGLALLGLAALARPALWVAALLFALPFYYRFPLAILPGRALGLIDIALLGGLGLVFLRWLLVRFHPVHATHWRLEIGNWRWRINHSALCTLYSALIFWSLFSTLAADHFGVALREWRVVFLAAGLFALLLCWAIPTTLALHSDHWLLIYAWLAGATVVALVALWQYTTGADLIAAEGVWRVRAFYGSPNNLALYLERTLAVCLGLALFARQHRQRWMMGGLAAMQGAALLLTFSKGALLLGLPTMLATLWLGGLVVLQQQGRSRRPLWWIAGMAGLAVLALLPFLGAERFQRLLDFSQGTGFLRLHLWRSAGQMALDHPLLGVGPDNFLYVYRSSYILPAAWQEPNLNHPHNWLLDWWTRLGLPGLLWAILFFGLIIVRLWRNLRQAPAAALYLGLLAATTAALAHGLIDASYALPDLMLVWVLLAYFPCLQKPTRNGNASEQAKHEEDHQHHQNHNSDKLSQAVSSIWGLRLQLLLHWVPPLKTTLNHTPFWCSRWRRCHSGIYR